MKAHPFGRRLPGGRIRRATGRVVPGRTPTGGNAMRAVRVFAGILGLMLALPAVAAGVAATWLTTHDSPDGAFHASIAPLSDPERVLVVPDLDAMLSRDIPYVRAGDLTLRLSASSGNTPAFIGVAAPDEVAAYLAGIRYTEVAQTRLGPGPLVLRTNRMDAPGRNPGDPLAEDFWLRQGLGTLSWSPQQDRGSHLALVVVLRDAPVTDGPALPSDAATLDVALSASWLASASWGLLILGTVLLTLAFVILAWPSRRHDGPTDPPDVLTSLLITDADPTAVALPDLDATVAPLTPPAAPEQRAPRETPAGVRRTPAAPWAGAPYTGPAEDGANWAAALRSDAATEARTQAMTQTPPAGAATTAASAMSTAATASTVATATAATATSTVATATASAAVIATTFAGSTAAAGSTVAAVPTGVAGVPGMRAAQTPPWPPLRGPLPDAAPVREVVTEEFLREVPFLDRPACTLRLDRDRVRGRA